MNIKDKVLNVYNIYKKTGLEATLDYITFSFEPNDIQKVIDYLKKNKFLLPKGYRDDATIIINAVENKLRESRK